MRLEQCVACEELDKDASNTPYVAREAPAQVQDDLRGSVMPGRYNGRMVLVIKGCRTKVDEPDFRIKQDSAELGGSGSGCRR